MKNIIGKKFNRIIVLKYIGTKQHNHYFIYKCRCGNVGKAHYYSIVSGHTKSCGCYRNEQNKIRPVIHGMYKTRFYRIWQGIKERCRNKKKLSYKYYGGKGIKNKWKSFEQFKKDMYASYLNHIKRFGEKNTSIDRKKNNGNYSKHNCRWATNQEQSENSTRNKFIIINNEKLNITQWAKKIKIHRNTLYKKIRKGINIKKYIEKKMGI